jgi:hypothetical protein
MTSFDRFALVISLLCRLAESFALPLAIGGLIALALIRTGGRGS